MINGKTLPHYLALLAIFFFLQFIYSFLDTSHLLFLLQPTNVLVQLSTGSASQYIAGEGFYHTRLNIVIDKSCSGYTFWLISFVLLAGTSFRYFKTSVARWALLPAMLLLTYVLTVFVNASRIIAAVNIQAMLTPMGIGPQPRIHEVEGVAIYLLYLIIFYYISTYLLAKPQTPNPTPHEQTT